ncbi:MAG: hypothetical protein HY747_09605 [Elusimicrobia bacterium]|nr:hypothetical protein [Elusimicrobiota bacterium]
MIGIWIGVFIIGAAFGQDSLKEYSQAAQIFENAPHQGSADQKTSAVVTGLPLVDSPTEVSGKDSSDIPIAQTILNSSAGNAPVPPEDSGGRPPQDENGEQKESFIDKFVKALPWALASATGGLISWLLIETIKAGIEGGAVLEYGLSLGGVLLVVGIFLLVYFLVTKKNDSPTRVPFTNPAPSAPSSPQ